MEYALRYQEHLRGLVISNMMSSAPAYNDYARRVLMPEMDQAALAEIQALEAAGDIENPRYTDLLNEQHYVHHVLRMPVANWPDPVQRAFAHINPAIYVSMQGPSELGISADAKAGRLECTGRLAQIETPALVIGAAHDTMDPAYLEMMSRELGNGSYLHCPMAATSQCTTTSVATSADLSSSWSTFRPDPDMAAQPTSRCPLAIKDRMPGCGWALPCSSSRFSRRRRDRRPPRSPTSSWPHGREHLLFGTTGQHRQGGEDDRTQM